MTTRGSIKAHGDDVRDLFITHVDGSRKSTNEALGDVVVRVDGRDEYVEVKLCGASGEGPYTVNQIRPAKYIPCVVFEKTRDQWWVLSPERVVLEAAKKKRGQHTENPFECMGMSLAAFKLASQGPLTSADLRTAVEKAIRSGRPHEGVRREMLQIIQECAELADAHRKRLLVLVDREFGFAQVSSDDGSTGQ